MHEMPTRMGGPSILSTSNSHIGVNHHGNGLNLDSRISQVTNEETISTISFDRTEGDSLFNEAFGGFVSKAILITVVFLFLFLGGLSIPFIFLLRRKARYTVKKFIKL
ncbi:conserved Plasmodium chabaudi protein, unknown function [Plasmodium chabaudi chabaudi]|uniref:Uncharacterized protein n=1 Tax=Plasmodium chabaudi chabaudi TaxID=31271 RepID=A0A4V0K5E7_PLACU|nr:conserved Plasmodium chabaudi protein, unknown function [Plasmodium chabaudi chabaudi]VTZ67599.1 conserved Plasmodium chabaudi protein, unknown function [Plasmodium chabaudi chabaudi]|eukprot:XP_016653364.1 conserved Plasmodium chabaudi protein, unknown function [Plasmodium chabaudi chabaudi]